MQLQIDYHFLKKRQTIRFITIRYVVHQIKSIDQYKILNQIIKKNMTEKHLRITQNLQKSYQAIMAKSENLPDQLGGQLERWGDLMIVFASSS